MSNSLPESAPPLILLGVRRSGTTLLRIMLDRNPELAIPDESYFVPQLARRHRGRVDPDRFVEDLRRTRRLPELGVRVDDVAARLRPGMSAGEAIGAIFATIAAASGKQRWGDKTPLYMQHLDLLARLWPEAQYVHLIRDGRDAALSFLAMPAGVMTAGWGHPRDAAGFACLWRTEVEAARALGARAGPGRYLELRYEDLVVEPESALRRICAFAGLPFDAAMLDHRGAVDVSGKPHQQRLLDVLTPNVRDWRVEMTRDDAAAFEEIAGRLLAELGYPARHTGRSARGALLLAAFRSKVTAWRVVSGATQRSPVWRLRHPRLSGP